eukprot:6426813-Amphidinium_carterae.1
MQVHVWQHACFPPSTALCDGRETTWLVQRTAAVQKSPIHKRLGSIIGCEGTTMSALLAQDLLELHSYLVTIPALHAISAGNPVNSHDVAHLAIIP